MKAFRDIVVVGASAGGVEALSQLVGGLPADFPAALFVVLHFPSRGISFLPDILSRRGPLPAAHPNEGDPIARGRVHVAPPGRHLLLLNGKIHLSSGPRENGFRPAIDPLFRSAARSFGPRVIGVVLSGCLGDGSLGLQSIKAANGIALVQDPQEAVFADMPQNAIESGAVDQVLPVRDIAARLKDWVVQQVDVPGEPPMADDTQKEYQFIQEELGQFESGITQSANATGLTCPECGGALWELREGLVVNYRCHVGHGFSVESLLVQQSESLEAALWTAVRALEERASLLKRMAARFHESGSRYSGERFAEQSQDAEQNADIIRQVLINGRNFMNANKAGEA